MEDTTPACWCWVPGYEGLYRVSDRGDVWSTPRPTTRGGLLKHGINRKGYHSVWLTRDGKQRRFLIHVLVMLAFVGPYPAGREVRHLDGDPANNRWAPGNEEETKALGGNLVYGTSTENATDKKRHGTDHQLNKTCCPQGHEYTPENTIIDPNGHPSGARRCKICRLEQRRRASRRQRQKRKEMLSLISSSSWSVPVPPG